MSRLNSVSRLPFAAVLGAVVAILITGPSGLRAQAQATSPSAIAAEQMFAEDIPATTQAPALDPQASPQTANPVAPAPTVITPQIQLEPEQQADLLSAHQHYQAAIAAYAKIPNPSPGVWNKMGIAYQMMFNSHDAMRCYNASLKLSPRNSQVLNNLATVYDSIKDYSSAERYYRKALKIDPHSALVLRNFGSNQMTQHRYKKGWDAYKQALAEDPKIFQSRAGASVENPASTQERGAVHYYMAKSCATAGDSDCAIQNLRTALNEGYTSPKKIAGDGSFASLRELPAFQQMIASQGPQ